MALSIDQDTRNLGIKLNKTWLTELGDTGKMCPQSIKFILKRTGSPFQVNREFAAGWESYISAHCNNVPVFLRIPHLLKLLGGMDEKNRSGTELLTIERGYEKLLAVATDDEVDELRSRGLIQETRLRGMTRRGKFELAQSSLNANNDAAETANVTEKEDYLALQLGQKPAIVEAGPQKETPKTFPLKPVAQFATKAEEFRQGALEKPSESRSPSFITKAPAPTRREPAPTVREPAPTQREGAAAPAPSLLRLPGILAERYRIQRHLPTQGAEADLLLIEPLDVGPPVVVKLYRPGLKPNTEVLARLSESHPEAVVRLLDHG